MNCGSGATGPTLVSTLTCRCTSAIGFLNVEKAEAVTAFWLLQGIQENLQGYMI